MSANQTSDVKIHALETSTPYISYGANYPETSYFRNRFKLESRLLIRGVPRNSDKILIQMTIESKIWIIIYHDIFGDLRFLCSSRYFVLRVFTATKLQALCEQNLSQSLGLAGQVTSTLLAARVGLCQCWNYRLGMIEMLFWSILMVNTY